LPGNYNAQLIKIDWKGENRPLGEKVSFVLKTLESSTLPAKEAKQQSDLNQQIADFRRVVLGTSEYYNHLKERVKYLREATLKSQLPAPTIFTDIALFERKSKNFELNFYGDKSLASREFETVPGFVQDMEVMVYYTWSQSYGSTTTLEQKFKELKSSFGKWYDQVVEMKQLTESIESKAEGLKMPSTFGRLPLLQN